ncbi:single-stranded-DNA-specific exonuclease RecJ [Candidatus Dojkabacteria bacterium]|nr:single-stranded-DNA-specific exonuclease RecJ [Candidatus Dojkabacteria bacterium]
MNWVEPVKITDEVDAELSEFNPILRQLLFNRGFRRLSEAKLFLNPVIDQLDDPLNLFDVKLAAESIEKAIKEQKRIFIHGDYDVDGVCATAILWNYLYNERQAKVLPFIPTRTDDGYGITEGSIQKLINKKAELVITVDCGIRDVETINKYSSTKNSERKLDFVITDHHEPGKKLPKNVPIVHPLYPDKNFSNPYLSGAAVAWYLVCALEKLRDPDNFKFEKVSGIDLVAFSIVCDLMPISGQNRVLVNEGIKKVNKNPSIGFRMLAEQSGVTPEEITTGTMGYILGPRINAAGRMGDATDALRLFVTKKDSTARTIAMKLGQLNTERQKITEEIFNESRALVERDGLGKHLYFACGNDWPEGIIGIVAGKLQEQYNRPVIVATNTGKEVKGSARSINGFSIINAIEENSEFLDRYGGHNQAAGFTLSEKNLEIFKTKLQAYAEKELTEENFVKEISADVIVDVGDLEWEILDVCEMLKPFGYGNRKPVFWINDAVIISSKLLGKENNHLKLLVRGHNSGMLSCIYFNGGFWFDQLVSGDRVDMVGYLESNEWNGEKNLQFRVEDIRKFEEES